MTGLLTRRQREVLILVANGNTNALIAGWLGITASTVNETIGRACRTLGAADRTQAVALALRVGEFGFDDIRLPDGARTETARGARLSANNLTGEPR